MRKKQTPLPLWLTAIALFCCLTVFAQEKESLTLDECYALARENYPVVKQLELIRKSADYSVDNASRGYLPQFQLAGQATYQSEVTEIPISLPNVEIDALSKDQYKLYGEVVQPLTDIVVIRGQKELIRSDALAQEQKTEVELYKLRDRINQLFFGILLIDARIQRTELLKKDIQSGLDKVNAAIENGVALKSSGDELEAELLKAEQRTIELKANRRGYMAMLRLFTGKDLGEATSLVPTAHSTLASTIERPELMLYEAQKKSIDIQTKLIDAQNLPRFSLFFQGGFGRPALNFLNNDFNGYYIGGLRLQWNLSGFYTSRKRKKILRLNHEAVDLQRQTFLLNTEISLTGQSNEIAKLKELIDADEKIIVLRTRVKNTAKSQLENGTITAGDYLIQVNTEDRARQDLLLHQTQLQMAYNNHKTTSGN